MSEKKWTARSVVEWDWMYTSAGGSECKLHHLAAWDAPDDRFLDECRTVGVSTCGIRTEWQIPGVLSRLARARCARCCDALGVPRGHGSPRNDEALRPWVERRLAAASTSRDRPA